ncbi:cation diffusion facilitator family transporter [Chitinophaga skermanii]|uniref:Cation diffusion facilitator family transporter n=1 Tax=Chitinophaga skermanii TaxID=331697 RepID=A0A327QT08_9BACT|nr:cation diffusion facilitator family transporter [Chitinophaga skermanii]RAJ06985.1 cation diffusion facilitator family transporter [Chitinophaga skermanii]
MIKKEFKVILISLIVSFVLTGAKFGAYFVTHSVAILSDALESIINVVAGAFACYSIYLSSKPKDENHPYGHGKVEFFSIGFEGAMIFIAGCLILVKAISYFFSPHELHKVDSGIYIIAFTSVVNYVLGKYLVNQGKKIPSITLTGNGHHILTDAYSSIGLIVALLLIQFTGYTIIDPIASIIMAILILTKGYQLMRRSISGLMDETDMQVVDKIIALFSANRSPRMIDVHNMRVQQYGNNYHIDCHITMPYYLSLAETHDEISRLEKLVNEQLFSGEAEFFIHMDPCTPNGCEHCLVEACPVRQHPFERRIEWDRNNVLPNAKHNEATT